MKRILLAFLSGIVLALPVHAVLAQNAATTESEQSTPSDKKKRIVSIELDADRELPQEVVEKLSPEQLHDLLVTRAKADVPDDERLIVAMVFGLPVAIVAVVLFYRHRKNAMLHRTLALMIEKGTPIPPELFTPEPKEKPSDLHRGIVLVMTGLGIAVFFAVRHDVNWGLGMIPLLIGAGYLIAWKLGQKPQSR